MERTLKLPHLEESNQTLKQIFWWRHSKVLIKTSRFFLVKVSWRKTHLGPGNIPKSEEEPINEIDRLAYIHDLAFQNSDDINERHRADQEMINRLKQLKNLAIPQIINYQNTTILQLSNYLKQK